MHMRDTGRAIIAKLSELSAAKVSQLPVFRCCYIKLLANTHFGLSIATAESIYRRSNNIIYLKLYKTARIYISKDFSVHIFITVITKKAHIHTVYISLTVLQKHFYSKCITLQGYKIV